MGAHERKYNHAIWELTEALQGEQQRESALMNCLEILKDAIGCTV